MNHMKNVAVVLLQQHGSCLSPPLSSCHHSLSHPFLLCSHISLAHLFLLLASFCDATCSYIVVVASGSAKPLHTSPCPMLSPQHLSDAVTQFNIFVSCTTMPSSLQSMLWNNHYIATIVSLPSFSQSSIPLVQSSHLTCSLVSALGFLL